MTDITQHVTSLELSKRLWELGVRRESEYYWLMDTLRNKANLLLKNSPYHAVEEAVLYPAYLASELGEMLPSHIHIDGEERWLVIWKYARNGYWTGYPKENDFNKSKEGEFWSKKLADPLGALLTYLIENGYVNVGEL